MSVELQSAALLQQFKSDRSCIHGVIDRGFSGPRMYQVFGFDKGFLFLEVGKVRLEKGQTGGMVGRVLGGQVGAMIGSEIEKSLSDDYQAPEQNFGHMSNDQLLAMARKNKNSFVAAYEDILWAKVEKTGPISKLLGDKNLGSVTLKEKSIGRVCLMISDWESMIAAVEVVPARLGERARVLVKLDDARCEFVSTRG